MWKFKLLILIGGLSIAFVPVVRAESVEVQNLKIVDAYSDAIVVEWQSTNSVKQNVAFTTSSDCISNGEVHCAVSNDNNETTSHRFLLKGGVGKWIPGNVLYYQVYDSSHNKITEILQATIGNKSLLEQGVKEITANSAVVYSSSKYQKSVVLNFMQNYSSLSPRNLNGSSVEEIYNSLQSSAKIEVDFRVALIDGFTNDLGTGSILKKINVETLSQSVPTISDVKVINITTDSAIATWQSSEPDISSIVYGLENTPNGINMVAKDSNLTTAHKLKISGLLPNTRYFFQIYSGKPGGGSSEPKVYDFTTISNVVPPESLLLGVEVKNITSNSVVVVWKSNNPDISSILYGTENSPNGINMVAKDTNLTKDHILKLGPLASDKKYYFQILSDSLTENTKESKVFDFKTNKNDIEKQKPATKPNTDDSINRMNGNAKSLNEGKLDELLKEIKQLRNELREQAAELKYLKMFASQMKGLNANMQTAMKAFITYGVDDNTQKLGEGERAAVISSYEAAFDKLPTTEAELADAIKIANGRFPSITNGKAEQRAKDQFFKIYNRAPDMDNANDAAAVKVMAYGLRQKAENRNMNSETKGIKTFKHIFGNNPKTTEEWNTMQAITYSGASKKNDTDKDGLADETEKKLGTDLNKADSDGDGFKDGTEVLKGFDPLKK